LHEEYLNLYFLIMANPPEQPTPEAILNQIGKVFFATPYRLQIGMWIARQEIGVAFNSSEVAMALEQYDFEAPETIVGRFMPGFVITNLAQTIGPTGRNRPPSNKHHWSRLENPWWAIFDGANRALDEIS
jgi:hypothetical protein